MILKDNKELSDLVKKVQKKRNNLLKQTKVIKKLLNNK